MALAQMTVDVVTLKVFTRVLILSAMMAVTVQMLVMMLPTVAASATIMAFEVVMVMALRGCTCGNDDCDDVSVVAIGRGC